MLTQTAGFVELKPKATPRYSNEERYNHCIEWKKSGLSMNEYCRRSGIAVSSLSKWVGEAKELPKETSDTLSVSLTNSYPPVEIILTSGLRIRLPKSNISEILKMVRALESCN